MKREELISKLDFAVILTIFTGMCYGITYLFYAGQFIYYQIPFYFIQIEAKDVFSTMLVFSPLIYTLFTSFTRKLNSNIEIKNKDERPIVEVKNSKKSKEETRKIRIQLEDMKKDLDEIEDGIEKEEKLLDCLKLKIEQLSAEDIQSKELIRKIEELKDKVKERENYLENYKENSKKSKERISEIDQSLNRFKRKKFKSVTRLIVLLSILISVVFFLIRSQSTTILLIIIFQTVFVLLVFWLNNREQYRYLYLVIILYSIIFPFGFGINASHTNKTFLTFDDKNKSYIVLAIYKDQFIYVPIDRKTNEYQQKFNIIEIKDVDNFSKESFGHIQKQNTSQKKNDSKDSKQQKDKS